MFVDNCLSFRHARALQPLVEEDGHRIVSLRDMFGESADDGEWISELDAQGGWCAITRDLGIATKPREQRFWMGRRLVVIFLANGWHGLHREDVHARLSRAMKGIIAESSRARPGTGYRLRIDGKLVRLFVGRPSR